MANPFATISLRLKSLRGRTPTRALGGGKSVTVGWIGRQPVAIPVPAAAPGGGAPGAPQQGGGGGLAAP